MKKVYETVSDMILPGIVFAGVMAILIGAALLGSIGKRMNVKGEDFSHMADTKAVQEVCGRKEPVIQCIGDKVWNTGQSIAVSQLFSAVDEDGGKVPVTVLDIKDQNGNSVLSCYQKAGGQAVFSQRGVYTFFLKAMDRERKTSTEEISILVDNRQG